MPEPTAFSFWVATTILGIPETEAREAVSFDGANDKGIDICWINQEAQDVLLVQCKWSKQLKSKPKTAHIDTLCGSLNWLGDPEALRRDGKDDLAQLAVDFKDSINSGFGISLYYAYCGAKDLNIEKHAAVYNQNPDNSIAGRKVIVLDNDELKSHWLETVSPAKRIDKEVVATTGGRMHDMSGSFGRATVVSIPGVELKRLCETYGSRLFDRNVRLLLPAGRGSVNAGIVDTLQSDRTRENFWAYNNGITVICEKYHKRGNKLHLHGFSIVNGCQTTSLVAVSTQPEDVAVLARIIEAPADIVDDIIRFTNSQNPVRSWDLASQRPAQRRLQEDFKNLVEPWIYLTRRGTRPRGDLKRYRDDQGRLRQISFDKMGQYAASFRQSPVTAYRNKADIFGRLHDQVFPPDIRAEELLFQWTVGELCSDVVADRIKEGDESHNRILRKGGVFYVLAIAANFLSTRNGGAYLTQVDEMASKSKKNRERLEKYARFACQLYLKNLPVMLATEREELSTALRSEEFFKKLISHIKLDYDSFALNQDFIESALPRIVFKR